MYQRNYVSYSNGFYDDVFYYPMDPSECVYKTMNYDVIASDDEESEQIYTDGINDFISSFFVR